MSPNSRTPISLPGLGYDNDRRWRTFRARVEHLVIDDHANVQED